jgi:putative ABC transport system permease protein
MNKKEMIKGSFRMLRRNKMRTFFMTLGIIISIMALIISVSVGKGFYNQMCSRVKVYLGANSVVIMAQKVKLEGKQLAKTDLVSSLTMDDMEAIAREVPLVAMFDPMQMTENREVVGGSGNTTTRIKGGSVNGQFVWNRGVSSGAYFDDADVKSTARVALIGPKIAAGLFGESNPIGSTIRIGNIPFTVKGVLVSKGVDPHGNDLDLDVVIPITTMMKRVMNVDYLFLGKVVLTDDREMDQAVKAITAVLKERHHITRDDMADFTIMTPAFAREKIGEITKVFNVFLPLISLVILLVSGIVVVVLMTMSVSERNAEIGLRKALGARSKDILYQFLIEASVTSFIGGITGTILGIALYALVVVHIHVPFNVPLVAVVGGFLLPVITGMLASIIPAYKASGIAPAHALKQ